MESCKINASLHGGNLPIKPPPYHLFVPNSVSSFIPAAILRYQCDNNPQQVKRSSLGIVGYLDRHLEQTLQTAIFESRYCRVYILHTCVSNVVYKHTLHNNHIYIYKQVYIPQRIKNLQRYMKRKGVESFCFTHLVCSKGSSRP